jgi:hypothetical protein
MEFDPKIFQTTSFLCITRSMAGMVGPARVLLTLLAG